jgi:hypothetical protein
LAYNTPRLIGVSVVADDLGCYHEGGDEEPVPGRPSSGGKTPFESGEEEEGAECDRRAEASAMKGVGDECRESWGGSGRRSTIGWWWGNVGTREQGGNKPGTHLGGLFMAVVAVGLGLL